MTDLNKTPWAAFSAEDRDLVMCFLNSKGTNEYRYGKRGKALVLTSFVTDSIDDDDRGEIPLKWALTLKVRGGEYFAVRFPQTEVLWTFYKGVPEKDYATALNLWLADMGYYQCPFPTYEYPDRSVIPSGVLLGQPVYTITEWREFPATPDHPEPYGCMRCPEWFRCTIAGKVISVGDEIA